MNAPGKFQILFGTIDLSDLLDPDIAANVANRENHAGYLLIALLLIQILRRVARSTEPGVTVIAKEGDSVACSHPARYRATGASDMVYCTLCMGVTG